jgi:hypothetical protein
MTMEFLFSKGDSIDKTALRQGDLLEKTEGLSEAIRQAHSYYADAPDYTHFLVLTQSCDLVLRSGKTPKSPYITLAAVRPLQNALDRKVEKYTAPGIEFPIKICERERRGMVDQFLERILHNTEEGFFFFRAGSAPTLTDDSCAFLPLSIALRSSHYGVCLENKVAQLDDIFAAKVGWLVGNMYSRVGTPDIEENVANPEEYKRNFIQDKLDKKTAWLSVAQIRDLKQRIKSWKKDNGSSIMTEPIAKAMLNSLPDDLSLVVDRAIDVLIKSNIIESNISIGNSARNILKNDQVFKSLILNSK